MCACALLLTGAAPHSALSAITLPNLKTVNVGKLTRRCVQVQPSLRQTIAQDVRLPLLEPPMTAAGIAKLGEDDPMLLTELLCGADLGLVKLLHACSLHRGAW